MIYLPSDFKEENSSLIHPFLSEYNFATLITVQDKVPIVSHLPFLFLPAKGRKGTLQGHMARANQQWRSFAREEETLVIFQGPHAYISPSWYETQPDNVPTWNYAVVHMHGIPTVIEDETEAYKTLEDLVHKHDSQWVLDLNAKDKKQMLAQIVVFEIEIAKVEAKFKLSQNRSEADQKSVVDHLVKSSHDVEKQVGELMRIKRARRPC